MSAPLLVSTQSRTEKSRMLFAMGATLVSMGIGFITLSQLPTASALWVAPSASVHVAATHSSTVPMQGRLPSTTLPKRQANVVTMASRQDKVNRQKEMESEMDQAPPNPMSSPIAWIGLAFIFTPIIGLAIGIATGAILLPN
uniref:Uncharacterized protein n=1 Tax=Eutreptiella gymnastica TaxID=73025 RepID=A0A7S4GAG4_9EUGL